VRPDGGSPSGKFRLISDPSGQLAMAGNLSAVGNTASGDVSPYPDGSLPDYWVIGGAAKLAISQPGFMAFALFGAARDVSVKWVAITQAAADQSPDWMREE
jgi:hypothetical protein